jgi:Plavaka transposase
LESSGQFCGCIFLHFNTNYNIIEDKIAEDPEKHGSMFVPVVLGSDKTTVSVATGQNEYYPLYASIGNVHNNVRHAYRNAVAVIGFLAIHKSMFRLLVSCFVFIDWL